MTGTEASPTEGLIYTIAGLLRGIRQVAVGASSPIPGAAALLAQAWAAEAGGPALGVAILGSRRDHDFTNGGVEIFDRAARGRVDAFFLGGGQIDGHANINLVGTGAYPAGDVRWPGSFGSAYLYHLVPRVILFREEHSRRVLVDRVDFVSAPGPRDDGVHRPGGPHVLLTSKCLFDFHRARRRFVLRSVHPGHTLQEVREATGFDFDLPAAASGGVPETPGPDAATLALMRGRIRERIARTYPKFAAAWAA